MISIYLCDDEESVCHQLKTALEWKIFIENYDMRVVCAASTAQELLDAAQDNRRGVYFLDVDLKDGAWDGFTLGRELRRRDPHGTLVYITSYGDLAWKTFQYHLEAFDYIVKEGEQTGPAVARCLEAVHARLLDERRDPAEMFSLRTGPATSLWPTFCFLRLPPRPTTYIFIRRTAAWTSWAVSTNWSESWADGLSESTGPIWRRGIRLRQ